MAVKTKLDKKGAVAIAKDMLKVLKLKKVRFLHGNGYLIIEPSGFVRDGTPLEKVEMKSCECCMLGGLLLAKARVFDDVTVSSENRCNEKLVGFDYWSQLSRYFGYDELADMEEAFEYEHRFIDDESSAHLNLIRNCKTPAARAARIARTVIANKGYFRP